MKIGEKLPMTMRRVVGQTYWSELDADDRLQLAERCLRDARVAHGLGNERRALDFLQGARSLIAEARAEIEGGA